VNVGNEYSEQQFDASLVSVTSMTIVGCDTAAGSFVPELTIVNAGTDVLGDVEITYSIDGGTAVVSKKTINLAVCSSITVQ
jgi:hypothetical protein